MTWLLRYQIRTYLRESSWVWALGSMLAALVLVRVIDAAEGNLTGWKRAVDPGMATTLFATLASSMFSFIVFVSSALLVAVQIASSQLTPRIIRLVFDDPVTRVCLMLFVFTFTFTLSVLARVTDGVPVISSHLAAYGSLACLAAFLFLLDHVGRSLRPGAVLMLVAARGRLVIASVYPERFAAGSTPVSKQPLPSDLSFEQVVANRSDGVILAFDTGGLVRLARRAGCVIELVPRVGDFVAAGEPLIRVSGGHVPEATLLQTVALGQERTTEQDPTFALRIIVDIASKGLSPAINDPTTAVLALDQLHHLLREVGQRQLADGRVYDEEGRLRLAYRTPDWETFVYLATTEIRQFGENCIQISRRMRAMVESLMQVVPAERVPALRQVLRQLDRAAQRSTVDPVDLFLATESDTQGVGGRAESVISEEPGSR